MHGWLVLHPACNEQARSTGKSQGTHLVFLPDVGRKDFCNRAGVCSNCLASQAQQNLLAKLKSAYQESALSLPASAHVLWLF